METGVEAKASVKNLYLLKNRWYVMLIKSNYKYINTSSLWKRVDILYIVNFHSSVTGVYCKLNPQL